MSSIKVLSTSQVSPLCMHKNLPNEQGMATKIGLCLSDSGDSKSCGEISETTNRSY